MKCNYIFTVLGAVFLTWFTLPFITHGILNVGNVTGIILSAAIILVSLRHKMFFEFLKCLWNTIPGKFLELFAITLAAAIILFSAFQTVMIVKTAHRTPSDGATVLVLGCLVYKSGPSLVLAERLDAAYEYLSKNEASCCVVSGGQGPDEPTSEAECM